MLGLKPTPCIKVATNTPMYERMIDDMDLDAGPILEGEPVESVGRRLFELILDVAGGRPTKSERQGSGGGVRTMVDRADPLSRDGPRRITESPTNPALDTRLIALATVAILELAWLGWFLVVPLPNVPNVVIRRDCCSSRRSPRWYPGRPSASRCWGKDSRS